MDEIFKKYDIRGIYPSEVNEEVAYRIARAYVTFIQKENKDKKLRIVVGRDHRLSSPQITDAVIKGLTDQGADVIAIGLAATPTFYFAVGHYNYDGGILVSASHNPKEYTGFKLVRHHAIPVSGESGMYDIRDLVKENKFVDREKGIVEKKENALLEHVKHDLQYSDVTKIKEFKIVVDPANSMGILYLKELFKHLSSDMIEMNFYLDGTFPSHQPDPLQDETLTDLKKKVVEEKADLGIATDGDGDRIFFIDNNGRTIPQPIIRGLMAQVFLKKNSGAKICYDLRPGRITRDMIEEAGGIPVVTKVGHSLIKEQTRKEDAVFAGESSGHFFVKMKSGFYEAPVIVILKLLEIMSQHDKPIAEIVQPYDIYFQSGEINSHVADKDSKINEIGKRYSGAKINWLDGVTVEYDDFWFNVRKSNTEPLLRLNLEAVSKEVMEEKTKEVLSIIRSIQ